MPQRPARGHLRVRENTDAETRHSWRRPLALAFAAFAFAAAPANALSFPLIEFEGWSHLRQRRGHRDRWRSQLRDHARRVARGGTRSAGALLQPHRRLDRRRHQLDRRGEHGVRLADPQVVAAPGPVRLGRELRQWRRSPAMWRSPRRRSCSPPRNPSRSPTSSSARAPRQARGVLAATSGDVALRGATSRRSITGTQPATAALLFLGLAGFAGVSRHCV